MTTLYTSHMVSVAPSAFVDAANALVEAQGWGPLNYSVPLSATGSAPATHYGLAAHVQPSVAATIANAAAASQDVAAVIAHVVVDIRDDEWGRQHFERVIADLGLREFQPGVTP